MLKFKIPKFNNLKKGTLFIYLVQLGKIFTWIFGDLDYKWVLGIGLHVGIGYWTTRGYCLMSRCCYNFILVVPNILVCADLYQAGGTRYALCLM